MDEIIYDESNVSRGFSWYLQVIRKTNVHLLNDPQEIPTKQLIEHPFGEVDFSDMELMKKIINAYKKRSVYGGELTFNR